MKGFMAKKRSGGKPKLGVKGKGKSNPKSMKNRDPKKILTGKVQNKKQITANRLKR